MLRSLVGSEMCIRDRNKYRVREIEYSDSDSDQEYLVESVDNKPDMLPERKVNELMDKNEIRCTARINHKNVQLKIDTGAKCNVLSLATLEDIYSDQTQSIITKSSSDLITYSGEKFSTTGHTIIKCKIADKTAQLKFQVVDLNVADIIGLRDAVKLKLISLHGDVNEIRINPEEYATQVFNENSDLFGSDLGRLPVVYKMKLKEDVIPVIKPPRKIPIAMENDVKQELQRMVDLGIIKPQREPTEWVSQMVAAKKKNGDIRVCIDPRDLNTALMRPHHPMRTVEDVAARMPNAAVFSTLDAKSGFWQISLDDASSLKPHLPHHLVVSILRGCHLVSAHPVKCSNAQWKTSLPATLVQ